MPEYTSQEAANILVSVNAEPGIGLHKYTTQEALNVLAALQAV